MFGDGYWLNQIVAVEPEGKEIVPLYGDLYSQIEETIRFGKQSHGLEDIRVLRYGSLRNLVTLATAAMFFASAVLGASLKLSILAARAIEAAKRFFGAPDFKYYALADGIREILTRSPPSPPPRCPYLFSQ